MGAILPLKKDAATQLPSELQPGDNGLVIGQATLDASGLTAARTLALPDKSGTLATTEDTTSIPADVVTATTYTLTSSDTGREKQFPNGCTVTLDTSVLTAGQVGLLRQTGASAVTVVAAAGTTIYPSTTRATGVQGALLCWRCAASSVAYVNGETA